MKWSKYNFMFKAKSGDFYLLYNTMSNVFLKLDNSIASLLLKIRDEQLSEDDLDEELRKEILDNNILVRDDNIELAKFKLLKQYNRMNDDVLSLTIAPTMACNLHCSYCFEQSHPSVFMKDDVEDAIIAFIKGLRDVKYIHISWFGGEPLLYFDRIVSLTNRIKSIQTVKGYEAEIITNGVNMSADKASTLENLNIKTVHVTIDGLESIHNERRGGDNHVNTFKKIISGLDLLSKYGNISKTIRVNIDKTNSEQFVKVFNFIRNRYAGLNFNTYIGFIKESYGSGNSCKGCFSNSEQGMYVLNAYKKLGMPSPSLLMTRYNYECIARQRNSFLIGPLGGIYKCWTDLGNPGMCLGNVKELSNISMDLLAEYMVGADPFEDAKCKDCNLLPFCGGGCPHSRIMNLFHGTKNNNCHFAKGHMEELLETYYNLWQSNQ